MKMYELYLVTQIFRKLVIQVWGFLGGGVEAGREGWYTACYTFQKTWFAKVTSTCPLKICLERH